MQSMPADRLKLLVKDALDDLLWLASRRELRRLLLEHRPTSGPNLFKIMSSYRGQGWYKHLTAFQEKNEYEQLMDWAIAGQPRVIVELGTAQGGTLLGWARIATELVVSVDLEHGIHGGGYPAQKQRLYREFGHGRDGVTIELVQADSQSAGTRCKVESILGGRPVDILFIDADHRLEGVRRDFALWSPLVRAGGFVVFHDIVKHNASENCHVDALWAELRTQYASFEIVTDHNQGYAGIGIIRMANQHHAPIETSRPSL
jgi:cephalosporin hydroxylase